MALTVLNIAFPFAQVSPDAVGGAEQVLAAIDSALVSAGHRSIVVAARASSIRGMLLESCGHTATLTNEVRAQQYAIHRAKIAEALERFPIDIVHMHGVDFYEYLPAGEAPVLATLHLPPDLYSDHIYRMEGIFLHCVSPVQHLRCPRSENLLAPIENGVEVPPPVAIRRRNYALSLGRICPEKGYHLAMDAARLAGVPFFLGGEAFPYETHLRYLDQQIRPREDRLRRWVGPLNRRRKLRALRGARCLLVPSTIAETSSLVTMEALACGTPVIAFRFGALPSLVDDGRTGFLVNSVEEMADAIQRADQIDPKACRAAARERFSVERMTHQYIDRYACIVHSRKHAGTAAIDHFAAAPQPS
jgi:glycosyltransferase involved in cell wall biosynthesis